MFATPPCPRPERIALNGRYARLEPLASLHAAELFQASSGPGAADRFAYLAEDAPRGVDDIRAWISKVAPRDDPLFFAVIDRATGHVTGRQALMRITPEHGVMEVGSILWGPAMARSRVATEALYLHAAYAFDTLGYRRFEWKCNDRNEPSKSAARRFGFVYEGLFRQHMWVKGANRDTAWFAMLDGDWPARKAAFERWLDPTNFDRDGSQRAPLERPIG